MCRDSINAEHEMFDHTGSNWSHWIRNKRYKEKFGSHTRKIFNRFTKKRQQYLENHT